MSTIQLGPEVFRNRHIGPNQDDLHSMLQTIGASSLEELISQTVPANIRLRKPLSLPAPQSEAGFLKNFKRTLSANKVFRSYIGMGYYGTFTPGVILRNILENPGWYTQYTPYQAEIAQGRLEALLNYQTMVCDLTGLEVSNASLLDEATAAAEAMAMLHACRTREAAATNANKFFVSQDIFPQTIDVLKTRAMPMGIELVFGDHRNFNFDSTFYGALVQYPTQDGEVTSYRTFTENAHAAYVHVAVIADLMSLVLLESPGSWGADVVVGSSQRFGVPMGYGGPHAAFFATRDEFKRQMPGRIIGVSVDAHGHPAIRMALQTREQHIRREKATSNICTAQVLLAVMASMYAVYHGPEGLRRIAGNIHASTNALAAALASLGYGIRYRQVFDTLRIETDAVTSAKIREAAESVGINFRYFENGNIGISLDETVTRDDLQEVVGIFAATAGKPSPAIVLKNELKTQGGQFRSDSILSHPVFNRYHGEHEMLRYIKSLENKDLSLNTSMIALGSCTMKLNASTEMIPVTWPELGALHPFVPKTQAAGYHAFMGELSTMLAEITGFDAVSLQPNSGAQGEYTGLMVIREYFLHHGQAHRNICLIPSSAHGTNPASAVMAGMKVVVVACDSNGNIDVSDLRAKAEQYKDHLAALMVTYPSTHGVFEESIIEICNIIHAAGGQVYMDGANMNAQVGLTSPRNIGADVCHLNLHKTFCIPHGGGGPGMGPICVGSHLAPFLPGHAVVDMGIAHPMHAVSAAPFGSASILAISYAYIKMMGGEGLTAATKYAILNANYIKTRLEEHFPILYVGAHGRVAHEMIVDMRGFKSSGVEVEDIAKRLMDYGFHAPTVSFPVAGTLMIEPTESESKAELDRFCDALIEIRKEIAEIEAGTYPKDNNVLKNAPHTAETVTADSWSYPYSRQKAAFPLPGVRHNKFWPSVSRVNNTQGDRVLICTCPPIEAYAEVTTA